MSFIITVCVREGIVMAADSWMGLVHGTKDDSGNVVSQYLAFESSSSYKLFNTSCSVGIATAGSAVYKDTPIAGHLETFIAGLPPDHTPRSVCDELIKYFTDWEESEAVFHVAGYEGAGAAAEPWFLTVEMDTRTIQRLNDGIGWIQKWDGVIDIVSRLYERIPGVEGEQGEGINIPVHGFTLQDAIDFAVFTVRLTADALRFSERSRAVREPVDVYVIRPTGGTWIARKTLTLPHR